MSTHNMLQVEPSSVEYGTPDNILSCVHELLGYISLDPATTPQWNKRVGSNQIFTENDNGLTQTWFGNVWMNHPFRRTENPCKMDCKKIICKKRGFHVSQIIPGNEYWITKLILDYERKNIFQSLNICYASTSESWYTPLLNYPTCFLHPRTNYIGLDGNPVKGVQKGSSITYLGTNVLSFRKIFSKLGKVMVP